MIVNIIKELRILVRDISEEEVVKEILGNLGVRYKMELRDGDGVKIFLVNLQNR